METRVGYAGWGVADFHLIGLIGLMSGNNVEQLGDGQRQAVDVLSRKRARPDQCCIGDHTLLHGDINRAGDFVEALNAQPIAVVEVSLLAPSEARLIKIVGL